MLCNEFRFYFEVYGRGELNFEHKKNLDRILFFKDFIYLLLERGEAREKEGNSNVRD